MILSSQPPSPSLSLSPPPSSLAVYFLWHYKSIFFVRTDRLPSLPPILLPLIVSRHTSCVPSCDVNRWNFYWNIEKIDSEKNPSGSHITLSYSLPPSLSLHFLRIPRNSRWRDRGDIIAFAPFYRGTRKVECCPLFSTEKYLRSSHYQRAQRYREIWFLVIQRITCWWVARILREIYF